jgi:serine/threonine protein kinase
MGDGEQAVSVWHSSLEGRYRLGELVGSGAVADVYRAEDVVLGRPVAVKRFRADHDSIALRRFVEEARALAKLSHPGLVPIFDAGIDGDRPYLVMRLIDGYSLRDRLRDGALAPDDVIELGARLATAIGHVHGCGLVHRDVKPSNILLDESDRPYLVDFGIALAEDAARLTATDEIVGTAAYLAPEQVLGEDIGPAVDVYALGLVLLECLTGELAYGGPSKVEVALARLHRPPHIPSHVPPALATLLTAMTANEPEARPTPTQCAARLLAMDRPDTFAVAGPPAARPVPTIPTPTGHRTGRRLARSVPAAALSLACIGVLVGFALAFAPPTVLTGLPTGAAAERTTTQSHPPTSHSQARSSTTTSGRSPGTTAGGRGTRPTAAPPGAPALVRQTEGDAGPQAAGAAPPASPPGKAKGKDKSKDTGVGDGGKGKGKG